jgi:hypothetical protein
VRCSEGTSFLVDSGRAGIQSLTVSAHPGTTASESKSAKTTDGIRTFMNLLSRRFSDEPIDLPADATPSASCLAVQSVIEFHEFSFGRGDINANPDHSHSGGRALPLDKSAILG